MKNIWTISKLTFHEALSRKIFILFFGISSLILLILLAAFASTDISDFSNMVQSNKNNTGDINVAVVNGIKLLILNPLYGLGIFLSIFSASSFIPNMLEKGNIDLLLSKPLSRRQLIWGKFFGGTFMVFVNVLYLVIGVWILLGWKFGDWNAGFLISSVVITFAFAILYSIVIFMGVLSRNSILAMMITYLIFIIISPVLASRDMLMVLFESPIIEIIIDGLYYIFPKTSELGVTLNSLSLGVGIEDFQPIITSFLFMFLIIELSIFIFNKKDY